MENLKPIFWDRNKETFEEFKKRFEISETIDRYNEQLEELFLIENPKYRFDKNYQDDFNKFLNDHLNGKSFEDAGNWFYFPWSKFLIHYLPDEMHQKLRTTRNKNLITEKEQEKFYNAKIGIIGLSVGSHAALTLTMMGAGRKIKIADPDEISGSNLNRIRADFSKVGMKKCDFVAGQIYQINPYAEIDIYPDGATPENLNEFLQDLDILVEECDSLEIKIMARIEAKKRGLPVIMATDNGDNVIIDIERYDINKNMKIFNGAAGDLTLEEFQKFPPQELPRLATKIAGPKIVVPRMLDSLLQVGKTLYSWPQLGDAATLSGVAVAYAVKRIALGEQMKSGKIEVNLDSIFDPNYNSPESNLAREEQRKNLLKIIGLEN